MIELKSSPSESSMPDMTALLDVIFILLVFLLLTANVVPKVLPVDLPDKGKAQAQALNADDSISITLFAEEQKWGLNGDEYINWLVFEVALSEKIRSAQALGESPRIVIAGDKQAPLEKVLQLFAWLQGKNLSAAQVMMNPE